MGFSTPVPLPIAVVVPAVLVECAAALDAAVHLFVVAVAAADAIVPLAVAVADAAVAFVFAVISEIGGLAPAVTLERFILWYY